MGATVEVARRVAQITFGRLPAAVVDISKKAILDTIGVILAGTKEPVTQSVAAMLAEDRAAPAAAQIGTAFRTSVPAAALLNATSGHALDYDDVSTSLIGHPSVVIVPAILAVGEERNASGRDVITAYAIGVEVMAKLGLALGLPHYERGWHATATIGTLGAAMAVGHLLGLNADQLAHALGIAVSMASGSRQNFGTDTKPLHAGHAARCGVEAARLAAHGVTADTTALEGQYGYFRLFTPGEVDEAPLASLGEEWDLLSRGLSVKKYPCCFATHRAADAALALAEEIGPAEIASVEVTVPRGGLLPLIHDKPRTGLEAKFSMPYVVAASLLDRKLSLRTFTDPMVARHEVQALLERVTVREDPSIPLPSNNPIQDGFVEVRVRLRNGGELQRTVEYATGSPAAPMTTEQYLEKYRDCALSILDPEQVEHSASLILGLEKVSSVRELIAVLTVSG